MSQAEAKEVSPQISQAAPAVKLKGPTITLNRGKSGMAAAAEQASQGQEGLTFFGKKVDFEDLSPCSDAIFCQVGLRTIQN